MHAAAVKRRTLRQLLILTLASALTATASAADAPPPATGPSIFDFGREGQRPTAPVTTPPATNPRANPQQVTVPPGTKVVQVLKLLDPESARLSKYEFREGIIHLHDPDATKISLPYAPAAEYDVAVDFVRTAGKSDVCVTFPVGQTNCTFSVGGGSSHQAWLGLHNGRWGGNDNPTLVEFVTENDHLYHEVIKVRRDGVEAYLDGNLICKCKTDGHYFSAPKAFGVRCAQLLGLGRHESSVQFRSVEVTNVSGEGMVATEKAEDGRPMGPRAVVAGPSGVYNLTAFDGTIHGWDIAFQRSFRKIDGVDKNPDGLRNFGGWGNGKEYISWIVDVKQAGEYTVALNYSCQPHDAGSEVAVTFDGEAPLPFTVESTGSWHDVRTVELGTVNLPVGKVTIALKATKKGRANVMDTEGLTLTPKNGK